MDHSHHTQALADLAPPGFDLVGALLLGLLGSVHCISMCGPLVAIHARRGDAVARISLYQVGRILAYAVVGLGLGAAGSVLPPLAAGLAAALAGVLVVVVGLGLAGVSFGRGALTARLVAPIAKLSSAVAALGRRAGRGASLIMGAAHALFPCPLLVVAWGSALALADPVRSTAMMLAFGVGTVPALVATAVTASKIPLNRVAVQRLAGVAIALWGMVLLGVGVGQLAPSG